MFTLLVWPIRCTRSSAWMRTCRWKKERKASRLSFTQTPHAGSRARVTTKAVKCFTKEPLEWKKNEQPERCRYCANLGYLVVINFTSYPWIPEELSKDHQVSWVQGQTHVGRCDGQHGHTAAGRELELLTQLLPFGWRSRAIDTDVDDVLLRTWNREHGWND